MKATPGPRLMTASLMRRNRTGPIRRRWRVAAGIAAMVVALVFAFQPACADAAAWLQRHLWLASAMVAFITAIAVARHRTATRAEFKKSWLSALPVRPSMARREALQLEQFPALAGALVVTAVVVLTEIAFLARSARFAEGLVISWCWLMGAFLVGAIVSYAIREPRPVEAPPGSRYVPKGQSMRGRPLRPSLSALGQWPVRRMFASAQPKLVARALMPVLLSIGIQSKADAAMVVIGLFAATGALALLIPSVLAVSTAARRWLAPLPLSFRTLLHALSGRAVAAVAGISAFAGFLLTLMDVSTGRSARLAVSAGLMSAAAIVMGIAWRLRAKP